MNIKRGVENKMSTKGKADDQRCSIKGLYEIYNLSKVDAKNHFICRDYLLIDIYFVAYQSRH